MSLGHSSICGASDTLLSGSVRVQKSEGVFFRSWSWCTWHHIGVSLLSDLFVVFFGWMSLFLPGIKSDAQVRFTRVGAHRVQPVLVQECQSSVIPACQPGGRGCWQAPSLGNPVPEHPETAQHSCYTSVGSWLRRRFGENIVLKWILLSPITTILLLFWAVPQRILGSFLCGVS